MFFECSSVRFPWFLRPFALRVFLYRLYYRHSSRVSATALEEYTHIRMFIPLIRLTDLSMFPASSDPHDQLIWTPPPN